MRLIFALTVAAVSLFLAEASMAKSATLFTSGFNAAAYGDFGIDRGAWQGESISLFRVKAGIQLMRVGPVGLTLGYQKNGFYTAQHNWDREDGLLRVDYRGPVVELHLFPSDLFAFAAGASINQGFAFRKETNQAAYPADACQGQSPCTVVTERSKLRVAEFTGQVGFRVAREIYLTLGFGQRHSEAKPSYEIQGADGTAPDFFEAEALKSETDESFFFVGLRGSRL